MNTWNLRDEILAAAHRWYWIVAAFLLGILIGWLVSFIWPAPYRAIVDIYVGLNAYRSNRDLYVMEVAENEFRNRDDYKNWQMDQLNTLALSDAYLEETLNRLQAQDDVWLNYDVPALRQILAIAWRNTGEWHFAALTGEADLSAQAAAIWSSVVVEKANQATTAAKHMILLDSQLNALDQSLVAIETRQILLGETQKVIRDWNLALDAISPDEPLPPQDHWDLLYSVAITANWTPGWVAVLEAAPPQGTLPADYQGWLTQVDALIAVELAMLPSQIESLQAEHTQVSADYDQAGIVSQALSAGLEVAQIKEQPPEIVHLRPVSTLMLVGGLLGVLAWMVFWLYQITRKTDQ